MNVQKSLMAVLVAGGLMMSSGCSSGNWTTDSKAEAPTQDDIWATDYAAAAKQAADSGKYMLVNFSGSDWCGWCIRLDKEVFSQKAFHDYATASLVPVLLDFPRDKAQSDAVKKQNEDLQQKYGVQGYPTVLILSSKGDLVAQTGYQPGGADAYVAHIKELIATYEAKTQS